MPTLESQRYRFGLFEADAAKGELRRRGERVRLQEQPFRLLLLLLRRAGEVVGREDFRKELWPEDTFVEFDNSLNVAVRKLRDALRDNPEAPRFVETVPRRGYRFIAAVTLLEDLQAAPPESAPPSPPPAVEVMQEKLSEPRRHPVWAYGLAGTALLIVAAAGIRFYLHRPQLSLTPKDTIIVADFVNSTGDPVFDDSLKQALESGLGQSPFLNVMSERKTGAILQQMGKSLDDRMTGRVAVEVCQRANSKVEVQGSILSLGTRYLIGLAAVGCEDGDPIAQEQVQVKRKEDVVASLGNATARLRAKLGESLPSIQKNGTPLELATTASLEALKAYNHALSTWDRKGDQASIPLFQKAIELDPNFATAYGALATVYHNLNEDELARQMTTKAYELRGRLPESERLSLEGRYHLYVTGDLYKAAQVYEQRIQNHENLPGSLNNLGNIEVQLGNYDEAVKDFEEVVRLDPMRAAPYTNLARILIGEGRLGEAVAVLSKADEKHIKIDDSLEVSYLIAFLRNDTAAVQRILTQASGFPSAQPLLLSAQANTEAYFGRFKKEHELNLAAAQMMERIQDKGSAANYMAEGALEEVDGGATKLARESIHAAVGLSHSEHVMAVAAVVMARLGDTRRAQAISQELDQSYPQNTIIERYWLPTIRGVIDLQSGRASNAIDVLSTVEPLDYAYPHTLSLPSLYPVYVRAQAYLAMGDGKRAAAEFQKIIDHGALVANFPIASLARLGKARALVRAGDPENARVAYEQLIAQWKDTDEGGGLLSQAKREIQHLPSSNLEYAAAKNVK